jgi:hypothetical protein
VADGEGVRTAFPTPLVVSVLVLALVVPFSLTSNLLLQTSDSYLVSMIACARILKDLSAARATTNNLSVFIILRSLGPSAQGVYK